MIQLGVLDQVYVSEGRTAHDALKESTRLAQVVEALGYFRFWVSEHHGMRAIAFSSPEVLIAHLAAATTRIRVGSGGIMLPHYSAYKVAENFRLLEALHPGRIDLGLGRAPGGMPLSTRALQEDKYVDINKYPQQVLDLIGYLYDAMPEGHPFEKLLAAPDIPTAPEIWLLGSSGESARFAAILGTPYAFAEFFGTPGGVEAIRYYREHFQPNPVLESEPRAMIATIAICAETEEEADRLAKSSDLLFLGIRTGRELPYLPSVKTVTDYPYTEDDLYHIRQIRQRRVIGTPERVKEQLLQLAKEYNVDEILINSPIHDEQARIRSYELIADAFGMKGE
ncbi:MAG: LLM class flavin-dependent oxidoreductase [Candidatus Carbobacillus altaicus]|uniref:Bacterial luciferase family protein n=1 Tax=Candidatus Carbonibacillus altaicus TaxID=2163959 RepID=A0A2R6Y2D8_9BACL|nr:LLM class flavin-dependent oxidoreductase [Candidatus Carbobacillus altaicus]PTQ56850.1 MAG: bacterial luciferase family protein [Candidatus Carbobacillus altaicus]